MSLRVNLSKGIKQVKSGNSVCLLAAIRNDFGIFDVHSDFKCPILEYEIFVAHVEGEGIIVLANFSSQIRI